MKNVILTAVLAALIVVLPACVSCPPPTDTPTCDVQNAEAIAGLVDVAAGSAMPALGILFPVLIPAYATFHTALPLLDVALNAALAEYESAHTGAWSILLAGLENLYQSFDKLWTTITGKPSLVAAAKATVKAQGAAQVLSMLKTEQGKAELLKAMKGVSQ